MTLLRSALFNAWFFSVTLVLSLAGVVVRVLAPDRALALAQTWARTVLAGARVICGIRVRVTGLERLPPGAALIASQHQSAFDTLIWAALLPKVSYVYKAELERIPLFGPILPAAGQIPLDRAASIGTMRRLLKATNAAKAAGRQIVIFPEGTRVAAGEEAAIRGGVTLIAARTGLPIYPVATDSGRYWGRRAFRKQAGCIRIHVCPPISPGLPATDLASVLKTRWQEADWGSGDVDKCVDDCASNQAAGGRGAAHGQAQSAREA